MARLGRRPGKRDTRADIVAAATACFAAEGYERASLRSIARRAKVDPALVHHYFDGKPQLFMAAMHLQRDPADIFDHVQVAPRKGLALARAFLEEWEPGPDDTGPSPLVTVLQALCSSPEAAVALREFLTERMWARPRPDGAPAGPHLRQALITSQMWGVAIGRHVLRLEPLASASLDDVVEWLAVLLDATFSIPFDSVPSREGSATP